MARNKRRLRIKALTCFVELLHRIAIVLMYITLSCILLIAGFPSLLIWIIFGNRLEDPMDWFNTFSCRLIEATNLYFQEILDLIKTL